ncbi:hydroxymethylglutaryl-CoA lyase [Roseomonas eburnea]|uniref:Hydroxymethylglutaryl-CoA lyase n=1 Tax=Neoroseomonas eburnea TaxID=1346889 RepID=A0A9X9XB74_9PROT|nr:hydroxymethylglutaryl-CoA lyase [Neoroseomonas eburnea]MBR0680960.1 hydroxymethylglutaryl-CoA lyase [Neoroseomonas eburnea]
MSDLPKRVTIREEGPREGFQIEAATIPTADKVRLIEALAETGLTEVQCVSFVDPRRVPGMADADEVARLARRRPDVRYSCIWLNQRGLERAMQSSLDVLGELQCAASETFGIRNSGRDAAASLAEQRRWLETYRANGIAVESVVVMTAFGCNIEGEISPSKVVERLAPVLSLATEFDVKVPEVTLADTVGWATPRAVSRLVGAVRERWPDIPVGLHLHDTRGTGLANAFAGLQLGITAFDASCAGLGGCPFAGHKGAAGNICTEDLVFLCEEMGIETGIDLDRLIECARLAEQIVGHPLPGKVMNGGSLAGYRRAA